MATATQTAPPPHSFPAELPPGSAPARVRDQGEIAAIWRRFRRHRMATASLLILTLIILAAVTAEWIAPYDPNEVDRTITGRAASVGVTLPSWVQPSGTAWHWLGTDELRRDLLTRVVFAGRVSLAVGFGAMAVSLIVGLLVGSIAGFYGGMTDSALMRLVDLFLSFPFIPLVIVISAMIKGYQLPGDQTVIQIVVIVVVLCILGWMVPARLIRGQFLSLMSRDFVMAAKALGASNSRLILHHLLPNSVAPILVFATLQVGEFIILESALSFLGLGISPPTASWGNMLTAFQSYMRIAPWVTIPPGLMIFLTVLSINFVGDGLRDALDPYLKER